MTYRISFLVVCLAPLLFVGCESKPKVEPAGGKVTFKGAPVTEGIVVFEDLSKGVSVTADLTADGSYKIATLDGPGLPAGSYKVAVRPPVEVAPVGTMNIPPPKPYPNIPQKVRNPATSGLTADVAAGKGSFDFEIGK